MLRTLLAIALFAAFFLPPAHAAAPVDEGRPIVIGRSYVLHSAVLGDDRRINVYLPAHYGETGRRFPVLYLLDGGEAEDFHHITGLAQVAAFNGAVQELIVVGIEGVDRRHDLTPPSTDPADLKLIPHPGGADAYRGFLVEEVKPWVAARYRVSGRSGLIGESLAGQFVVETLLRAPQDFDDYIAASPSLWWADQAVSREAAADLRKPGFAGRRLWLGMADEGATMQAAADRLIAALKAGNVPGLTWTYDPRPTERHDTIYDPVGLAALRAIYATPKP